MDYGRFFKLYMYTVIAPIPLSTFAGEPTQSIGKRFLKSYAGVCLEGAVIVQACIIFSVFASNPPEVDTTAAAATMVWIGFTQANREKGIRRLMAINLMKRLESSVYAFKLTLERIRELIDSTIRRIDAFNSSVSVKLELSDLSIDPDELDSEDQNSDELFSPGKKVQIDLADMDYKSWRDSLTQDSEILELLTLMVSDITPEHDSGTQS